jgi:hypothetical protein
MTMASVWTESKLAGLWGSAKTERLLATGALRPYHTDQSGRLYFAHDTVMEHYQYKSPDAPGRACCTCCGHCAEPAGAGVKVTKAFGPAGGVDYQGGYGAEPADGDYPEAGEDEDSPQEYLQGEQDEDEDADGGELEPADGGAADEEDGEPMDHYIDRRLKALDDEQRWLAALERQFDLFALESASFSLAAQNLFQKVAVARMFQG